MRLPGYAKLLLAALFVVDFPAFAQAPDDIDEIVVIADFREKAAADTAPAVRVLGREAIEGRAIQHFEELVFAIPNMNWSADGQRARYFQIRGVGELEEYGGAPNPSVGFLIDDIDFSGIASVATLFDVQQIDVLRGPQGSRYGANALAGLVYVRSAEPTDEPGGLVRIGAGGDDARSGGIAFGGPLAGTGLRYRVAAHYHESDGFRDNPYLGRDDTNGRRESMLRGKLDWAAGDWSMRLTGMYTDIDDGYDAFAIDNSLTVLSDKPGQDAQRSTGGSLRAEWHGSDRYAVTSITAVADSDIVFSFDADWGNAEAWAPYTYDYFSRNDRQRRTLSQEIRVTSADGGRLFGNSTDWLAGVYVLRLDDDLVSTTDGEYYDPFADFALAVDDRLVSSFESTSAAVFAQLDVDVGDRGHFTAGMRGEHRWTDYSDNGGLAADPAESMLGGDLRYRYDLADRVTTFVSLSRGYKAGGFNTGLVPEGRRQFSQEALWNLEAGARSSWLNDRLQLDGSVFYARRTDQQVKTSFQVVPNDPASFVFYTDNAASGSTLGAEAELRYAASEAWQWYASVGLLRAEFDEFETPQVQLDGRDQAHAPNYTISTGVIWRQAAGFFARLDVAARDAFYFDVSHNQRSEAAEIVNTRIGYESDSMTLQFWVRNLFDAHPEVRGFYFGNEPPDFADALYTRQGDPRQLGFTAEMRF